MKVNMKVLVSSFCIISSCIFTFLFLFISNDNNMNTETIASTNKKSATMVANVKEEAKSEVLDIEDDIQVEEVNTVDTSSDNEPVKEEPKIVYDGMTIEELAAKLDRSLKNELAGKGYLYASYSLEKGVDPYLAVAISLEETGCNWNCSSLVKTCNNVGGMKGTGCGSYSAWPTIDDGIKAFIDNIYKNYVAFGLTTADLMNPKYAENPAWSTNVNNYINIIKNK